MRCKRRCFDHEGVGGFLESILAVMTVITASSIFMVVLASGAIHVEKVPDKDDVAIWLESRGLYFKDKALQMSKVEQICRNLALPNFLGGVGLVYRLAGNNTPLFAYELGLEGEDVISFHLPLVINHGGRGQAGVLEVRTCS